MKYTLKPQEVDNALLDCQEYIKENLTGVQKPHIVSLYRGSLPIGVSLSNALKAPLSIIDYQTRDGKSKKPKLLKNAGITASDLLVVIDDICDSGKTFKLTEEYIKSWFPNNQIIFWTIIGSKEHPEHYKYSIEHPQNETTGEKAWVIFPWETIEDTRCKSCHYSEPCWKAPDTHIHCNTKNCSFINSDTCDRFIPRIELR